MKKLNFAIFGALMLTCLATQALDETTIPWTKEGCESVKGTWIIAHSPTDSGCDANHCNGLSFCRSNATMNWWSGVIWCKSIGHELTDIETACPNGLSSGRTCANLNGKTSTGNWTVTSASSTQPYLADGKVTVYGTRADTNNRYAFCKE